MKRFLAECNRRQTNPHYHSCRKENKHPIRDSYLCLHILEKLDKVKRYMLLSISLVHFIAILWSLETNQRAESETLDAHKLNVFHNCLSRQFMMGGEGE